MSNIKISVAKGDGIGPEIMDAVISIFDAAQVPLQYEFIDMGKSIYDKGFGTGMTEEAKNSVETNGILFKGPMAPATNLGPLSLFSAVYSSTASLAHFAAATFNS